MAKITTRPADSDESVIKKLQEILDDATHGVISANPNSQQYAGNDVQTLLENVESVISLLHGSANKLYNDLSQVSQDYFVTSVKLEGAIKVLESFIDVSYDEALDHATADLMDAFAASGSADVTAHGELGFNESITFSKSDLKPILREAILRYLDIKLSQ